MKVPDYYVNAVMELRQRSLQLQDSQLNEAKEKVTAYVSVFLTGGGIEQQCGKLLSEVISDYEREKKSKETKKVKLIAEARTYLNQARHPQLVALEESRKKIKSEMDRSGSALRKKADELVAFLKQNPSAGMLVADEIFGTNGNVNQAFAGHESEMAELLKPFLPGWISAGHGVVRMVWRGSWGVQACSRHEELQYCTSVSLDGGTVSGAEASPEELIPADVTAVQPPEYAVIRRTQATEACVHYDAIMTRVGERSVWNKNAESERISPKKTSGARPNTDQPVEGRPLTSRPAE